MRVLVDIGHPGHVHFFRQAIARLRADGHEVALSARAKDVTVDLLRAFALEHRVLSSTARGVYLEYPARLLALVRLIRDMRPNVVTAVGGAFVAPAARLTGARSVVFTDTEHVAADRVLTYPWATRIVTPNVFKKDLPRAHHRYAGLHELAYLHPARFTPDRSVLGELGLADEEPFAILRLVSWQAAHDRGHHGFSAADARSAAERLGSRARVFVSAEGPIPEGLLRHRLPLPPHRLHDALALARLYLGDGATMATEAGLLGTPSVYVSTLVGTMGNFDLLEREGLVRSFHEPAAAVRTAEALLADHGAAAAWRERARAFAGHYRDTTDVICSHLLEVGAGR
jgi:uncharacterized protein